MYYLRQQSYASKLEEQLMCYYKFMQLIMD